MLILSLTSTLVLVYSNDQFIKTKSQNDLTQTPIVIEKDKASHLLPNVNENLTRLLFSQYVDVLPNGIDVSITSDFTCQYIGLQPLYFLIYQIDIQSVLTENRISSFIVYDDYGSLYFEWEINDGVHILNITLSKPLYNNEFYSFSVNYMIEDAILETIDITKNFVFRVTQLFDENVEQYSLVVTIPDEYMLNNESALTPDADYISINGKRFEWKYYNLLKDSEKTWIIRFVEEPISPLPTPVDPEKNNLVWLGMIGTFFLGLIIGAIIIFFSVKSKSDFERKEILEVLLSQPEKDIIKIIEDENRVTTQSKICSLSGFSKAKVSYYLNELEDKGIISRERWGRMNRVRIVDGAVEKAYSKVSEPKNQN